MHAATLETPARPGAAPAALALTAAQLGIWLGQQLDLQSPAYWTAEAIELIGELDVAAFDSALSAACGACESLHQRFECDGKEVWQVPNRSAMPVLRQLNFSAAAQPWDAAWQWIEQDLRQTADLKCGPLYANALLRLAPTRHLWVLRAHHIALDGYAFALLSAEVAARYAGQPTRPGATLQAAVAEAAAYRNSEACSKDRAFWLRQLEGAAAPRGLAAQAPIGHGVQRLRANLPAAQFSRWQHCAEQAGVDWTAWLIAAVFAWLRAGSGEDDLCLGLPVMGRLGSVTLNLPCMAMNIVPLRLRLAADESFASLASRVAAQLRAQRAHQRYRYEWLRHDLQRSSSQRLFGPVVNLMPFARPQHFGQLELRFHAVAAGPVEDLALSIAPGAEGLRLDLEANPAAYDAAALQAHHGALLAVLEAAAQAPQASLDVLAPVRRHVSDGGTLSLAPRDVLALLEEHAALSPQATALEHEGSVLSYAQLLEAVRALAGRLDAEGLAAQERVAILLPRSPQAVVAILAVLWAGGVYLPLDPAAPQARLDDILADAQPRLLLSQSELAPRLQRGCRDAKLLCLDLGGLPPPRPLARPREGAALAYQLYTSGSTGRPNGVLIERSALAHFVAAACERYALHSGDRVLQFAPLHFDASVEEIFCTLAAGAALVLRNEAMLASLPRFISACAAQRISVLDLPTAFWHELVYCLAAGTERLPEGLRLVVIGGEAALPTRLAQWRQHVAATVRLLNTYGPTETTVICTTAELAGPLAAPGDDTAPAVLPIGRPLAGLRAVVVDAALRPLPPGEAGELCLIGPTLARGYHQRPSAEAARFVSLTALADSPRAYRTGDLVKLGRDGALYYLGRIDDEFKLSGVRIDPNEVEAALLACPGVAEAAVLGEELPEGAKRLVAYVVCAPAAAFTPAAWREALAQVLPAAAVPSAFGALERLPRNANGKIDRRALRAQRVDALPSAGGAAAASSTLAQRIGALWCEVLGCAPPQAEDNFFALGGKSLQAIQLATRLGIMLGREVEAALLYAHPTLAALTAALGNPLAHRPPAATRDPYGPLLCLQAGEGPALFCIHPAEGLSWCYLGLAAQLPGRALFGLQARGISGKAPLTVHEQIDDYLALIRAQQPHGPYQLLGWSSGGGIAHALAARLQALGEPVALLAMMDAYPSDIWAGTPEPQERDALLSLLNVAGQTPAGDEAKLLDATLLRERLRRPGSMLADASDEQFVRLLAMTLHSMHLYRSLAHPRFAGDLLFLRASQRAADAPEASLWQRYLEGGIECIDIDASHYTMAQPAPLARIGAVLAPRLCRVPQPGGAR